MFKYIISLSCLSTTRHLLKTTESLYLHEDQAHMFVADLSVNSQKLEAMLMPVNT